MRAMRWLVLILACNNSTPRPKLPYTLTAFDNLRIHSHSDEENFQKATVTVDLHDGPFASATLSVDLSSTCFPFSSWTKPPAGQRWPADCDAFDRNFEFTLDEPASSSGAPAIELMRAITPFGGPEHQEIDFTDVANGRPGMHTLTVTIPTWSDAAGMVSGSDGGWNVSASLQMTPGTPPSKVVAVIPLINLSQGASGTPPIAAFDVPENATSSRIEYRATGHGGATDPKCSGPAEEFCKRTHHVLLDGVELQPGLVPWRNDCFHNCTLAHYETFDYCIENPCGDINSVEAARANWCPGTLTLPITWEPTLSPGSHQFTYAIDGIADGGSWRLSTVAFLFAD
jgi:hypothetical protein